MVCSVGVNVFCISQGNVPSMWAHTFQIMKMAEAFSEHVDCVTLLTRGALFSSRQSQVDLCEWYGVEPTFQVRRLPLSFLPREKLISAVYSPPFAMLAAWYAWAHQPDLVYTRYPLAGCQCLRLGLDTIIETHADVDTPEFAGIRQACLHPKLRGVVTVNDYLGERWLAAGVPPDKLLVWPDAVSLKPFQRPLDKPALRARLGLPQDSALVTYFGHFYEEKGVHYLVEAARSLPDVRFLLVGGWPADAEKLRARAHGQKNVEVVPFVPNKDMPKYLGASDVLVLPNSAKHEFALRTSPLKLFEYMAARRPVLASAIPALRSILSHRDNAFLVEPDSPSAIVEGVKTLLADPLLAEGIAERAFTFVQRHTWSRRARDILMRFGMNPFVA
jgi:glycosyltransferase involved in cell wall biosynthesis